MGRSALGLLLGGALLFAGCGGGGTLGPPLFTFAVIGDPHISLAGTADSQDGYFKANSISQQLLRCAVADVNRRDVAFTIPIGDLSNTDRVEELSLAKQILDGLDRPYFPMVGNHDNQRNDGFAHFNSVFDLPALALHGQITDPPDAEHVDYTWDYQGFHFIIADATLQPYQFPFTRWHSETFAWIRQDLESHAAQPTIFLSHYALWDYSCEDDPSGEPPGWKYRAAFDPDQIVPPDTIVPGGTEIRDLLESHANVVMAIAGHIHHNRFKLHRLGYSAIAAPLVYPAQSAMLYHVYPDRIVSEPVPISDALLRAHVSSLVPSAEIRGQIVGANSNAQFTVPFSVTP